MVAWVREGEVFAPGASGDPDSVRAFRPWVVEQPGRGLRMWYSGHDGTTSRILEAVQAPGRAWERLGVAIDAGFAGDSDRYGVESPCVVWTPAGPVMAYAGFDGDVTRLHMAASDDGGRSWRPLGIVLQRGPEDRLGATHPCLVLTASDWWMFFSGYDGSADSRRATILAAVSASGSSWDRVGPVLEPIAGELATSHPCVLDIGRTFYMFYASEGDAGVSIAMATSGDGVSWERHGTTLAATGDGVEARGVHTPCIVRLQDGSLHMWYAGLAAGDSDLAYRICAASFDGTLSP